MAAHTTRRGFPVAAQGPAARLRLVAQSFFFQAEDGIRDADVTGVQTCALPISATNGSAMVGAFQLRQLGEGKIPWSAMQNESVRKGDMLRCGWEPPVFSTSCGAIATFGDGRNACLPGLAQWAPLGSTPVAVVAALAAWVWVGSSWVLTVCDSSPPRSPRV